MSGAAIRNDTPTRQKPHLRLVESKTIGATRGGPSARAQPREHDPCAWDGAPAAHVLVAGVDAGTRSRMLDELRDLLPAGTRFLEAGETWEVIARASTSNMVVLAGDLGDISPDSLMRLLGRRHPTLPVLAVAEKTPADVDVAVT